ncbi:MAG: hypothetical protein HXY34_13750 [Candidatus Thorarchaeota archaeon]|nr:hypothetical protein [Candidatus Thorarchaeota archaeon]
MATTVTKALITDFPKFKAAWEKDAGKPENTILYYIMAALKVEDDPELADAMMTVVVTKDDTLESSNSPSGYKLRPNARYYIGQFKKNPHIARSYVGGTPDNDYAYSKSSLKLVVTRVEDRGNDTLKIFIDSGGKDLDTPVTVAKNKSGQWKLIEYSSICTGVRPPKSRERDF